MDATPMPIVIPHPVVVVRYSPPPTVVYHRLPDGRIVVVPVGQPIPAYSPVPQMMPRFVPYTPVYSPACVGPT